MSGTSRLGSLLVRDGVVDVRRMEKAFQRQVLFDGALDTILLEMNEVPEQRLLQYLSLATGLPPATARELEGLEPRAAARCPRELAERFRIVPLALDGDALRVLARDPVHLEALEELARELGAPVQPFVAPEFRYELAFDRVYGRASDERFTRLAEASRLSIIPPVGGSPSVVVGTLAQRPRDAPPAKATPVVAAPRETAVSSDAPMLSGEPTAVSREPMALSGEPMALSSEPTAVSAEPAAVSGEPMVLAAEDTVPDAAVPQAAAPEPAVPQAAAPELAVPQAAAPEPAQPHSAVPEPEPAAAVPEPAAPEDAVPEPAPEVLSGPAAVVVIEYDMPDSGALALTAPLPRPVEDVRDPGIVSGEIGGSESGPPVAHAPEVPTGPMAAADSGATTQAFRRQAAFDPAPLAAGEARALLGGAQHRDEVFEILLRAIRARTWYVGLLTVQGGAAIGRVAIAGDEVEQSNIAQVLIPLDAPSAFRQAVQSASPYIGPIATGDREIDGMVRRLGGVIPPSALLLPVVLRNRVVALLLGHRGGDMLMVAEVSELLPLAAGASEALGRIIMRGKAQSRQMTAVAPHADSSARGAADQPAAAHAAATPGPAAGGVTLRMPAASPEPPVEPVGSGDRGHTGDEQPASARVASGTGRSDAVDPPVAPEVEALMVAVEGAKDPAAGGVMEAAVARAADVLPWLRRHFPGKLQLDRHQIGGRHMRAAQHGHLLELVVRIGAPAAELVIEKLRDNRPDARYYAALCASEMRLELLLAPLVERMFDTDGGTRAVAIEGLSSYPPPLLEGALERARRELHGDDLGRVEIAAAALAELADVSAIPELLEVHGRGGESTAIASRALVRLTKQDFGDSSRKWRHWWEKNRQRNRIEWLLEGLAHKDSEVRRSAAEDLRKATGEYFGYHHDLPRREREQARQRWIDWWNQTGRTRFQPSGGGDNSSAHRH